jgi:hypothetical protein
MLLIDSSIISLARFVEKSVASDEDVDLVIFFQSWDVHVIGPELG